MGFSYRRVEFGQTLETVTMEPISWEKKFFATREEVSGTNETEITVLIRLDLDPIILDNNIHFLYTNNTWFIFCSHQKLNDVFLSMLYKYLHTFLTWKNSLVAALFLRPTNIIFMLMIFMAIKMF